MVIVIVAGTITIMVLVVLSVLLLLLLADGEITDHVQNVGAIKVGQQT